MWFLSGDSGNLVPKVLHLRGHTVPPQQCMEPHQATGLESFKIEHSETETRDHRVLQQAYLSGAQGQELPFENDSLVYSNAFDIRQGFNPL